VGEEYTYTVGAPRSLGDLSARMQDGNQVAGYFDIEKPEFSLTQGPTWLTIEKDTGVLSGTPDVPGSFEVIVTVTINRNVRRLDESRLIWGQEKVLSEGMERLGEATQEFVIAVR